MATDNKNIFVNPIFCNWLSSKGRVFVICHEILHCLLLHFTRADAKHLNIKFEDIREKWNHATDNNCVFVSAVEKQNIDELREMMLERIRAQYKVRYPYKTMLY